MVFKKLSTQFFISRTARQAEHQLTQRNVFTFPNKAGLMYLITLLVLYIASANYSLNLGFIMTYLLLGLMIVNAIFSFRNLAYIKLKANTPKPVFAGEMMEFPFQIHNSHKFDRFALFFHFPASKKSQKEGAIVKKVVDIFAHNQTQLSLHAPTTQRGFMPCPKLQIETFFPLGILRAWSNWHPLVHGVVYPSPETNAPPLPSSGEAHKDVESHHGQDDYDGVRPYQHGDPLKHIAWKHVARIDVSDGGNLISKRFSGHTGGDVVIDFDALPSNLDAEKKLSRLCAWLLEAEKQTIAYAFKCGSIQYDHNLGQTHLEKCLTALAMYGTQQEISKP